jgi:hypothetical protein
MEWMMPFLEEIVDQKGKPRLRIKPHPGQWKAAHSTKRCILVLAGTQSGKTTIGPVWLRREIEMRGPGDYLVISPTYPLLSKKVLPEFLNYFQTLQSFGIYHAQQKFFLLSPSGEKQIFGKPQSEPTKIFFAHAQDPESLESATAKAAWLDEAGQKKFRLGSWEAIQRRLAIHKGRVLITTTPYDLGWLKTCLFDEWVKAGKKHPEIDVINFDSLANPAFPRDEYERAQRTLPRWKFDMFYRGVFSRPAGLIYSSFDEQHHVVPRFALPKHWPRYLGLDFGGVNTAGVFLAQEQDAHRQATGRYYVYRTYHEGSRSAKAHVEALLANEPMRPHTVGGAGSEDQWRDEFSLAGLSVQEPTVSEVEVGIGRVFAAHAQHQLIVFDDLAEYLDEKNSYSREIDESGNPTEKIEAKETYHIMDAERYIVSWLFRPATERDDWSVPTIDNRSEIDKAPPGVFSVTDDQPWYGSSRTPPEHIEW